MTDPGDPVASTLAEAKRIADGLGFATRILGMTPDFTACGGPAAEAYWSYFTPARMARLLSALDRVLELAGEWGDSAAIEGPDLLIREAIRAALAGEEPGGEH
jgi:hypothetical protein